MKKILLASSILISSLLSLNFAFAQDVPSGQGITIATVNIYNARIDSQSDRNLTISFDLSNKTGVQPEVKYSVRLTEVTSKGEVFADQKVYDDVLSLGENITISKTVSYSVPTPLPQGTYNLWIESKNGNDLTLAVAFVGKVKITSSNLNTVEIVPGSCYLVKNGSGTHYDISGGVSVNSTGSLTATCQVVNNFSKTISVLPAFQTKIRSLFGNIVDAQGGSSQVIKLVHGQNTVSVELPKVSKPQTYNALFSLVSTDGKINSNNAIFKYSIEGDSGSIGNAVFDKDFYKSGDTAKIQVFSTVSSAQPAFLGIIVKDNLGVSCSSSTKESISQGASVLNIQVPIIRNCVNPKISLILFTSLDNKNTILDSKDFEVITPENEIPKSPLSGSQIPTIIFIIVLIIAIIALFIIHKIRKNKNTNNLDSSLFIKSLLLIILGASLFGASKNAFADTVVYNIQGTMNSVTFTTNLDQSIYNPGEKIVVTSSESGTFSPYTIASTSGAITGPLSSGGGAGGLGQTTGPSTTTLVVKSPSTSGLNSVNLVATSTVGDYTFDITDALSSSTNKLTYPNRTISQQVSFTVNTNPKVTISASPSPVLYNGSTVVSWSATNSIRCDIYIGSISGTLWKTATSSSTSTPIVGSATYSSVTAPTAFTANCKSSNGGPGGMGTIAYTQVGVIPTVTISAASTTIPYNTSTLISWNSNGTNNSYQCTINKTPLSTSTNPWKTVGTYVSQFSSPQNAITVDSNDNLYVAGVHNGSQDYISKFDSSGNLVLSFDINTYADYSSGSLINYSAPVGIAVDSSGNIYTIDVMIDNFTPGYVNLVRKFGPSGNYITQLGYAYLNNGGTDIGYGMPSYSGGGKYNFQYLTGITFDKNINRLYVSNYGATLGSYTGGSSRVFTLDTNLSMGSIYGDWGPIFLGGIAVDPSSNYYLVNQSSSLVQKFNSSGSLLSQWNPGQGSSKIAVDSQNNVYVGQWVGRTCSPSQMGCIPTPYQSQIEKFDSNGGYLNQLGTYGTGLGQFSNLGGIAADSKNNIYVVDSGGGQSVPYYYRTQKFNLNADTATSSGPLATTTVFDISCVGGGYTATSSVTVNVTPSKPIVTLSADKTLVPALGATTTLTWTVNNATSYQITTIPAGVYSFTSGPIDSSKAITNSIPVTITADPVFVLNATNSSGLTATASTTVYVQTTWKGGGGCTNCASGTGITLNSLNTTNCAGTQPSFTLEPQYSDTVYYYIYDTTKNTSFQNGAITLTNSPITWPVSPIYLPYGDNYNFVFVATNAGSQSTTSASVNAGSYSGAGSCGGVNVQISCVANQSNLTSPIYINKQMTWSFVGATTTAGALTTTWSGTNIAAQITTVGTTVLPKIYTTIGNKIIYATTTNAGKTYTATCIASTTVTSSGGSGGEI